MSLTYKFQIFHDQVKIKLLIKVFMNLENNFQLNKDDFEAIKNFKELLRIIHMLKDEKQGCPWHQSQSHESLSEYLLEESYEFISAVPNKKEMTEELGDILFQVMLHSEIGNEKKEFQLKDVINNLNLKIKSRHPYVFQKKKKVTLNQASEIWRAIKDESRNKTESDNISNRLKIGLKKLSPPNGSRKISEEISEYGFQWVDSNQIIDKVNEEIKELIEAITSKNKLNINEELGDVFFTLISLASFLDINYEEAIRSANTKFLNRFEIIEKIIGDRIKEQSNKTFQELWIRAKENLKILQTKND